MIVEAVTGGNGAKEYLRDFSEHILRALNPNMPQKNVQRNRYQEGMSPGIAEHVEINRETVRRNNSLGRLGKVLSQFG